MNSDWKIMVWSQFGAAVDMLENAIRACPDPLWGDRSQQPEYWYLAYHTLFFLDCYLSPSLEQFTPPPPFTRDELDPAGILPDRVYSRQELQSYLDYGRDKCRRTLESITEEEALKPCGFDWLDISVAELLLYNMRHVQHHAAQLNLILRRENGSAPRWVRKSPQETNGK